MSRAKQSVQRIREQIPLSQVLSAYGYHVYADDGEHEQQFSCDLHGDGQDNTPSARLYPDSNKFYCFACGKVRDTVTLVMEKEGVPFWNAVQKIEKSYGLAPLPWTEIKKQQAPKVESLFDQHKNQTPRQILDRVGRLIQMYYEDENDGFDIVLMWEAHDRVDWYIRQDEFDEGKAKGLAIKVLDFVKNFYR